MPKILTIVGARPQFVKAAAISRQLNVAGIKEILVHTGQHFDANMAEIFFQQMNIPEPNYNLGINSLSHGAMTGRMLEGIEKIILKEKPDAVVVFGDTNSTIAGALAASKLHVPVAHVEAGLRSFNMNMPEEINRILTDRISDILFCPTQTAVDNLHLEGFKNFNSRIVLSGDVMYDTALYYSNISADRSSLIKDLRLNEKPFFLATIHREENTEDIKRLKSIISAFNSLASQYEIVLPLHPRTRKIIDNEGLKLKFNIINPVGYFDMIELLKSCKFVISDSGGLQKEAFFFEKNCLVIRNETEWTELVELGYNFIVGADETQILEKVNYIENQQTVFNAKPYGDGNAAAKIVNYLNMYGF